MGREVAVFPSTGTTVEFSDDGLTTTKELLNTGEITGSGGDAPATPIVTNKGVAQVIGHTRPANLSIELPSLVPHLAVLQSLRGHQRDRKPLHWRIRTAAQEIFPAGTATAAIATNGLVTLAGTPLPDADASDYAPGYVLRIGGGDHTIQSVDDDGLITVTQLDNPVTAAAFSIRAPELRLGWFVGTVMSGPANIFNLPVDGALSGSVGIALRGIFPDWEIA